MFFTNWLAKRAKEKKQKEKINLFQRALNDHISKYLYGGDITSLSELQQKTKDSMIENLGQMLSEIETAENSFLKMREIITSLVYSVAGFQVLALTEEEKQQMEDVTSVPWISGSLHHHLPALVNHFEELKKDQFEMDIPDEELLSYCNMKGASLIFYLDALNLLRSIVFQDQKENQDWFRPFLVANMIWWESIFRGNINLDNLGLDAAEGIMFSTFARYVNDGADNPFYDFDKVWKKYMSDIGTPDKSHHLKI